MQMYSGIVEKGRQARASMEYPCSLNESLNPDKLATLPNSGDFPAGILLPTNRNLIAHRHSPVVVVVVNQTIGEMTMSR